MIVDPMTVCVCTPTYDGTLHATYVGGLIEATARRLLAATFFETGCSNVALARNRLVHKFLKTPFRHLAFVDADIGFTAADWLLLLEDTGHDAVCARYRKKDQQAAIQVHMGLGFARVSRELLESMAGLTTEDGRDWLQRFTMEGELWVDYFPQGVMQGGSWRGEDHGFWLGAKLTGADVRVETRTRLAHTGNAHWVYDRADFPDDMSAYGTDSGAERGPSLELPSSASPHAR